MSHPLHIAIISPYPPSQDGIADYAAKAVTAIERSPNVTTSIFSFKKDGTKYKNQFALLSYNPADWLKMYKVIVAKKPHIIHVQFDVSNYMLLIFPLCLLLTALRRKGMGKIVATFHEAYRDKELYGFLSVIFYRFFTRLFHRIYVHTHLSKQCLITAYRTPPEKIACIPHGTNAFVSKKQNHTELRRRFGIGKNQKVVLSFGYIYRSKGLEYLIDAIAQLKQRGETLPAVIIAGEVPKRSGLLRIFQYRNERYLTTLKQHVTQLGLTDTVSFVGFIPKEEVYSVFTLADVTVLPYVSVDQSGVLNFAVAAHTPVIATNIGGIQETLAETGILVPPRDSAAICDALFGILTNTTQQNGLKHAYMRLAQTLNTHTVIHTLLADYRQLAKKAE